MEFELKLFKHGTVNKKDLENYLDELNKYVASNFADAVEKEKAFELLKLKRKILFKGGDSSCQTKGRA
jgi:hypothetical protein